MKPLLRLLISLGLLASLAPVAQASAESPRLCVFIGTGESPVEDRAPTDFFRQDHWENGLPPGPAGDDVIIRAPCLMMTDYAKLSFGSLKIQARSRGFVRETLLEVLRQVRVDSGALEIQKDGRLVVDGPITLGEAGLSGGISLVDGLPKDGAPRIRGESLEVGLRSTLAFRWLYTLPSGLPGNTVPLIQIAHEVRLPARSALAITLEKSREGVALAPGEYLLLAAREITGPLPRLTVTDAPGAPKLDFSLQLNPERTRLSLVVRAAP